MGLDIWLVQNPDCFGKRFYKNECIKYIISLNAILELTKVQEWQNRTSKYPDHLCTPTYLRSSYNATGYNRVAEHLGMMDLYQIFEPIFINNHYDTDCSKEKLELCLENSIENLHAWNQLNNHVMDYYIEDFSKNGKVYSAKEIMNSITSQLNTNNKFLEGQICGFANLEMIKNPTIYCVIPNVPLWENSNFLGTMIVFNHDITFYKQMAEIIVEFIQNALSMEDPYIGFWG